MNYVLTLLPQASANPYPLTLQVVGDGVIALNGEVLDVGFLQDGQVLPPGSIDHPLLRATEVRLEGGVYHLSNILFKYHHSITDSKTTFPEVINFSGIGDVPTPNQEAEPEPDLDPDVEYEELL